MPARTAASSPAATKSKDGAKSDPEPVANGLKRICRFASHAAPSSNPSTPTFARSPSNSAFVACVVECAIKAISADSIFESASSWSMPATMPVATPLRSWCVVGTFTRATSSRVAASIATTSVKVPPTSIPTRSFSKAPRYQSATSTTVAMTSSTRPSR